VGRQVGKQAGWQAGRKEWIALARWNGRARRESRHSRARSGVPRVLTECPREKSEREWEGESERKSAERAGRERGEQEKKDVHRERKDPAEAELVAGHHRRSGGSGSVGRKTKEAHNLQEERILISLLRQHPLSPARVLPSSASKTQRESRKKLGVERERTEKSGKKTRERRRIAKDSGANKFSQNYPTSSFIARRRVKTTVVISFQVAKRKGETRRMRSR